MPAIPAPITAMRRAGAGGFDGGDFFVMVCFYGGNGVVANVL
jgi:hypothetical protein